MTSTYDIAERAKVNQSTVSRVLSGFPNIRAATVDKVMRACRELNYVPNAAARSLRTQKSHTIAIHLPGDPDLVTYTDPFLSMFLLGINNAAAKKGYSVILCSSTIDSSAETVTNLVKTRRADGVILTSPWRNDPRIKAVIREEIPCVTGRFHGKASAMTYCVDIDNKYSGWLSARYLASKKYHRIAVIAEPNNNLVGTDFISGFKQGWKEEGKRISDCIFRRVPTFFNATEKAAINILSTHGKIDAIATTSPLTVFAILKTVESLKPGTTVLGVDSPLLQGLYPGIPRLVSPIRELGKKMANTLIDIIEGKLPKSNPMLRACLIDERNSEFVPEEE